MTRPLIVDCHMHIRDDSWNPPNLRAGMDGSWARQVRWFEQPKSQPEYLQTSVAAGSDPTGDKAVARMDEAGVDVSVMMPMDHGVTLGEEGVIPIAEKNRLCGEAAR
ncbi:MAG: hypothetical protein QF637_08815, partial [Acidimicrobiales bacterium]|nr:hypothetical protein [Acidimicrobiales bacterium]